MNIYIKSFNRPFYLDRCIQSIMLNVKDFRRIIVLDDGTQSQYLHKLKALHPNVEFRSSGATDRKLELLRVENFSAIQMEFPEPSDFWFDELNKDPDDYFFLIEDDAWFSRRLDLTMIRMSLEREGGVIYKCWWPEIRNKNHHVDLSLMAANGMSIEYFHSRINNISDIYAYWIVAFAIFRRDYWLNNFSGIKRMADEKSQLCNAMNFIQHHPEVRFSKSASRIVYQGWAVPGRSTPEYYDKGLRQHLYMDVLNDAWLAGSLDVSESFPHDFSNAYLLKFFTDHLSTEAITIWHKWKTQEIKYQYN